MSETTSTAPAGTPWARPVPLIGDRTAAVDREAEVGAWALPPEVVAALESVVNGRRDIRRYRADAVPQELLSAVLRAGHAAPSVGHSQPWRFIVVRNRRTRERVAWMADRERLRQALKLTPERAGRLLDLQLEGIREAPLGIVVACDRRAPSGGVLGRNTFPDADMWSAACAVQNMWLTARALGLGMGWVTLMRPTELNSLLMLPEGVETLGWLCLGWPDERPPYPGLERRAWSRRLPLDQLVMEDHWADDAPEPPLSALAASALADTPDDAPTEVQVTCGPDSPLWSAVEAPSRRDVVAARDLADTLLTPPGSLGKLDQALDRVVAAAGTGIAGATLVMVGADHPVTSHGISAYEPGVTHEVMLAALAGQAVGAVAALSAGMAVTVVDAGVGGGSVEGAIQARPQDPQGDLVQERAISPEDVARLVAHGRRIGADAARHGIVCLGEVGVGNTTVASALACALTGIAPERAAGIGAGSDAAMVERKVRTLRAALQRVDAREMRADPAAALSELGGPEFAVLAGVVLGAAEEGSPIVLDGLATSVAALAVVAVNPAVQSYLVAGHVSREEAHRVVLTELGLEPLGDLRLRSGEGVGACLAAQSLLTGLAVRRDAGRTASSTTAAGAGQ